MNYTRHVVKKRETFSQLAKTFGVSASEIARVNGLSLKSRLRPGAELVIPRAARRAAAKQTVASASSNRGGSTSYRIRKGDTLSHVAARHSTTVAAIKALNRLNSNRLSIGQVLVVSAASTESSSN
jgi:LysM repeat protein